MISKDEKIFLFIILLLTVALRLWGYSASRVEHFDEGVYASNIWFNEDEGYRYPDRHLYAPPLLPTFIEWSHVILGPTALAPLLPGLLSGIATVPLLWWFGRKIAGPLAGLSAAALLATNEAHILYSRTALTEPLLCFWMLLAVYLAHQSFLCFYRYEKLSTQSCLFSALAGLTAGLAWLTKYNGWLALAVIFSASVAWGIFSRFSFRKWKLLAIHCVVILLMALLIWLPYLSSLQKFGGYATVAGNHQQYFVGLTGWVDSLLTQISKQLQLIGFTTACGFGIVAVLIWRGPFKSGLSQEDVSQTEKISPTFLFRLFGNIRLGGWMTASWLIGLSVAIPLYYPYPRLCVPWMLAFCMAIGLAAVMLQDKYRKKNEVKSTIPLALTVVLASLSLIGPLFAAPAWESREGLFNIAGQCVNEAGETARSQGHQSDQVVFYVYGEPALFYHLSAADRLTGPIGHLDFAKPGVSRMPYPTFLVIGPHAQGSELFHQQWKENGDYFKLIAQYEYHPSLLIKLNQKEAHSNGKENWQVKLYLLK